MNKSPSISTVIPCYNAGPFLRETIDSVLNQTRPPLELIIVDDGSTDDSAAIARSYGAAVRLIQQENQGESTARNRGMDEAEGEWIALLDADDRWRPHKLERQTAALAEAENVACVYCDYELFGTVKRHIVPRPMWPIESERRVRMLTNPWIQPGTAIFPKELGRQIRFPVNISDGEDQTFFMELYDRGAFIRIPEAMVEYRKHPNQQTSQGGHGYHVISALWGWVKDHPDAFNADELQLARRLFAAKLVGPHDEAYWKNDLDVVTKSRDLYAELCPRATERPPLFERDAPSLPMRAAHGAWNSLLNVLPRPLHNALWSVCHGAVDKIKRGS